MSMFPNTRRVELEYGTEARSIYSFFNAVYAWMAVGLAVTAVTAWIVAHTPPLLQLMYAGPGVMLVMALGAFGIAWYVQSQFQRIHVGVATALFLLYAAIIGALISGIFLVYPASTLISALVLTGGVFGGMSIDGFVTKKDLTSLGAICFMCLLGLILATIVNFFFASNMLDWIITYGILAVFIGLTAYDTQKIKELNVIGNAGTEEDHKEAIHGALVLYLDFVNLYMMIMRAVAVLNREREEEENPHTRDF